MREIILDTETTGINAREERIVEIGCVEMVNRFLTGRTFQVYLNPEKEISAGAVAVHGLSAEFLADKPKFADVVDEFLAFIEDSPLVIHNASFDMGFLNAELERAGRPKLPLDTVVDTLLVARRKHPGVGNKLDDLCNRYGINNTHRTKHGALLDAEILSHVYVELLGGRQTTMNLGVQNTESSDNFLAHTGSNTHFAAKQREKPLPNRLTEQDHAAHTAFIEKMGEGAIWKKYSTA